MSEVLERSQSMTAYAQTFGEPDAETTGRMRKNLRKFVVEREAQRTRRRHWVQASVVVGGLAIGIGALVWTQSSAQPGEEIVEPALDGVVATGERGQEIELAHGGTVRLEPQTRMRILADEASEVSLELRAGALELEAKAPVAVQVERYRVETEGARVEIRHTRGVPLVEVSEGEARLYGPDLPQSGVTVRAAE